MIAKLRRIAIYDTINDKLVKLTTIQEGVEGSGGFFYEEEEDTLNIDDDQAYLLSFLCRLETRVLGDSSVRSDLMDMVGSECIISGVGIDGFVQFGRTEAPTSNTNVFADTVKIVAVDQIDKSTVFRIVAQRRTTKAYIGGVIAGGVGALNSAINLYNVASGISGLLYGFYGNSGGTTYSIVNTTSGYAVQDIQAPGVSSALFSTRILFPFEGIPITLSFRQESTDADGYAQVETYTGTTVVTFQSGAFSGAFDTTPIGTRRSVTITPTSTTTFVGCSFGTATGGTVAFSLPAMRVNALTSFEKY